MAEIIVIIAILTVGAVILAIIRLWLKQLEEKSKISEEIVEWLKSMGQRIDENNKNSDAKLSRSMEMFNTRLDRAAEVIGKVQRSIGEFSEIGRSMKQLQDYLQSPKLRGNIGEQILNELLAQCLPAEIYKLQYSFPNGDKVDAVIKTRHGLIPIDSKFPIDNFRRLYESENPQVRESVRKDFLRDVKKHIQDIAKKYIQVGAGTVDYALMYIPSEAVYYEVINQGDLYDFTIKQRVIPVSPLSFYAYLKAILISLEGQRIQSQAKEILALLQAIKQDYEKTDDAFGILNRHITNAYNQTAQVDKQFTLLGQKINSAQTLSAPVKQEKLLDDSG